MFSLIITIISIALVAALALATIYYGGSAFNRGSDAAKASQLINEGQQVNGAFTMAKADAQANGAAAPTDLAGLVANKYLAQAPASFSAPTAVVANGVAQTAVVSDGVADEVVKKGGTRFADLAAATSGSAVYGVIGTDDSATQTVFYKY